VPSPVSPTVYHLYISGDYEVPGHFSFFPHLCLLRRAVQIRLFGDPRDTGSEVPALSISVNVYLDSPTVAIGREASRDVIPDFVDGFAFGDALGIGLRCISTSSWTVTALSPSPESCHPVSRYAFVGQRALCLSWFRELHSPFLERLGLLWVRHACCPFASRNLGRSAVIRSHSTYMLLPANHR
jgi:hypothetical protein